MARSSSFSPAPRPAPARVPPPQPPSPHSSSSTSPAQFRCKGCGRCFKNALALGGHLGGKGGCRKEPHAAPCRETNDADGNEDSDGDGSLDAARGDESPGDSATGLVSAGKWRLSHAVKQSARDLLKRGVTPYVCTLCHVVFNNAQGALIPRPSVSVGVCLPGHALCAFRGHLPFRRLPPHVCASFLSSDSSRPWQL